MLQYENVEFFYDPFPIARLRPALEPGLYQRLVDTFPPVDQLRKNSRPGQTYYFLNETRTPDTYNGWISAHPEWRDLHRWVKSRDFLHTTMRMLLEHHIDVGYFHDKPSLYRRVRSFLGAMKRGRIASVPGTPYARFEFAMLSAGGGAVLPHTDAPSKFITIVIYMRREDEWDPAYGGGLDVNVTRDPRYAYAWVNPKIGFEDVDVIRTFGYEPNQAVIFIKTHNSWHSVRPLTGPADAFRKSICINVMTE